jgi:ABC-2 type transport system permease protein
VLTIVLGFSSLLAIIALIGEHFGMLLVIAAVYTLTMVSFSMLFAGILKKPEQFSAVFPILVAIMPMLGGAYVPPGAVTNPIILNVAEIVPLTHAMQALTGIAVYGENWSEVFMPVAKLFLIGVICMGVGINLMERQKA